MQLKAQDAQNILNALVSLDGRPTILKGKDGETIGPMQPYDFDATTQYNIILIRNRFRTAMEPVAEIEKKASEEHAKRRREIMKAIEDAGGDHEKVKAASATKDEDLRANDEEFEKKARDLRDMMVTVRFRKLEWGSLKTDANRIPLMIQEALMPVIKGAPALTDDSDEETAAAA